MFTDYLSDNQLRCLRKSELDGRYPGWPVTWEKIETKDGSRPNVRIVRCWRCGEDVANFQNMTEDELSKMEPEEWIKLFPYMMIVVLPLKGRDEPLPIVSCDLCCHDLMTNESPSRVIFVLSCLWAEALELIGTPTDIILSKMREIENLQIEGEGLQTEENLNVQNKNFSEVKN